MQYKLTTPCSQGGSGPLRAGDTVLLSGTVYTARDAAHKRMMELLDAGEALPSRRGLRRLLCGPHAGASRTDHRLRRAHHQRPDGRLLPRLLDLGQTIMIGKGARNQAVKEAVVRSGAVYLAALGGAGALMAASVEELEVICWEDLGCEAVRRLTVRDLPLTVILDAHGGDLYESGPAAYLASL